MLLFLTVFVGIFAISTAVQSVGVRGRLMCGDGPLTDTQVKLWDEDTGPNPDDVMDEARTDSNGNFEVEGSASDIFGSIDPILKIYHNCDDTMILGIARPCRRKVKMEISSQYINEGYRVRKWFDVGTMNMMLKFGDEERKCL